MERKPNENAAEAPDDSLFTSATRVQIPLGTPDKPPKTFDSGKYLEVIGAGDRGGDSGGLDSNVDAILDVAAVFELINPDATDVPSRIRQLLALAGEVRRMREEAKTFWSGAQVLAMSAEIDRLREGLEQARAESLAADTHSQRVRDEYEEHRKRIDAKLRRVEALLFTTAFGRSKPEPLHEHALIGAKALRTALKG